MADEQFRAAFGRLLDTRKERDEGRREQEAATGREAFDVLTRQMHLARFELDNCEGLGSIGMNGWMTNGANGEPIYDIILNNGRQERVVRLTASDQLKISGLDDEAANEFDNLEPVGTASSLSRQLDRSASSFVRKRDVVIGKAQQPYIAEVVGRMVMRFFG